MKTDNKDIQDYVDSLTKEERQRNQSLKQQLQNLNISQSGQTSSENLNNEKIKYTIDKSRYDRDISANTKYIELQKLVTGSNSPDSYIGYEKDLQDILIRSDRDVMLCFKEHFAISETSERTIKFINFTSRKNDMIDILKLNFDGDYTEIDDSCIFKLFAASKSDPAVFFGIKKNSKLSEVRNILSKVKNRQIKKISFIDSDGDTIEMLGDTEWEYFLNDCEVQYKNGMFNILYAE